MPRARADRILDPVTMESEGRISVTFLRRLAAALATAGLVLAGAAVGAPAAAGEVTTEPQPYRFSLSIDSPSGLARAGGSFQYGIRISREGPAPAASVRPAVKLTWPDDLQFVYTDGCEYYISADGLTARESGETVDGDDAQELRPGEYCAVRDPGAYVTVNLSSKLAPETVDLPLGGSIDASIPYLVDVDSDTLQITEHALDAPVSASAPVDYSALYHATVSSPVTSWVPGQSFASRIEFSVPNISGPQSPLDWVSASTTWDIDWPDELSLDLSASNHNLDACGDDPGGAGHCRLTIDQYLGCPDGEICESDPDDPAPLGDVPSCGQDFCVYVVVIFFVPPESGSDSEEVAFDVAPVAGTYRRSGEDRITMGPAWMEGSRASTLLVRRFMHTSVELSAPTSPVGGADVSAAVRLTPIDGVIAVVMQRIPEGGRLAIDLRIGVPPFLQVRGSPSGCDDWDADDRLCRLTFPSGADPSGTAIGLQLSMPLSLPDPSEGQVSVEAVAVNILAVNPYGSEYIADSAPNSAVAPSSAAFEVFEPIMETAIDLSSPGGRPGGEDLLATFTIQHRPASSVDFDEATAEVRLSWPTFLSPISPPSECEQWLADSGPDAHGGICRIPVRGSGGPAATASMVLPMPSEADPASETGEFSITGVRLVLPSPATHIVQFPGDHFVPATEPFSIDSAVFPVDVTLDRAVSTPGGLRVHAEVTVRYARELLVDADDLVVGLDIDWPGFLTLTSPPGPHGCDAFEDGICYVTGLEVVGDAALVELWFDMPPNSGGIGEISAVGVFLCDGPYTDCNGLPEEWVGSDAEPFAVLEPQIRVDVVIDRETGWTGGQPVTATAIVTHEGPIPGALPGLTVDLSLAWPGFLTGEAVTGCDAILPGGVCRITGLDAVESSRQLTIRLGMPVEAPGADPATYPRSGEVRVRGLALTYLALPATPLPEPEPDPEPEPGPGPEPGPEPEPEPEPEPVPVPVPVPLLISASPSEISLGGTSDGSGSPDPQPGDGGGTSDGSGTPSDPTCPVSAPDPQCVPDSPAPGQPAAPEDAPEPVVVELPEEWIGSDSAQVTVLMPKVTAVPGVIRPGQAVTVYVENVPPGAGIALGWSPTTTFVTAVLPAEATIGTHRMLIVRRAALGPRMITLSSPDGLFGPVELRQPLLVVPRSTVADELVGRGG